MALVSLAARRRRRVVLLDFEVLDPASVGIEPMSREQFVTRSRTFGGFSERSLEFQERIIMTNGIGDETYLPPALSELPPRWGLAAAREEAELVLGGCLRGLLAKTSLKASDIDILIVNCSLFNPTPSLSALVINRFGLRQNVKSYNLAGMGCSAGVVAIDLAADLLRVSDTDARAVVLSTENITMNWYIGDDRSMLMSNTLFRVGGAAMLLSNRADDAAAAKYELETTVRVTRAADDASYKSVFQREDSTEKRTIGVSLSRDLLDVVGEALKANLTKLGPLVLPYSEQVRFFLSLLYRRYVNASHKQYIPNFRLAFNHYAIHAGGRAIIDGLQTNLGLSDYDVEPSRATLYRFGNTR